MRIAKRCALAGGSCALILIIQGDVSNLVIGQQDGHFDRIILFVAMRFDVVSPLLGSVAISLVMFEFVWLATLRDYMINRIAVVDGAEIGGAKNRISVSAKT